MSDERLKIAVFIDFDNIEIGVKSTLGTHFDIGSVLEAIKERGEIVTKIAYGDWTRAGDYGRSLSQHAVHMVQRNLTPGGDKNGADINLALDALEMAFTHSHINSFVVVSGDSDFISLVEKLKQYDRKVFVLGGRAFTSVVMQKNCTEFIAYENIVGRGRVADRTRSGGGGESPLSQAMPLVRRALKLLNDREVLPQLGLLKSTLLQLDSAFSEREYGAGSFRDFVQKLARSGYLTLKGSERSFHVELREGNEPGAVAAPSQPAPTAFPPAPVNGSAAEAVAAVSTSEDAVAEAPTEAKASASEGLHLVQQAMGRASTMRWPLYVRQIKQLIRGLDPQFDERRYGFSSLIEMLKYCQREGALRVERDCQGVVRVWPGAQTTKAPQVGEEPVEPRDGDSPTGEVQLELESISRGTASVDAGGEPDFSSPQDRHDFDPRDSVDADARGNFTPSAESEAEGRIPEPAAGENDETEWSANVSAGDGPEAVPTPERPKGRRRAPGTRAPRARKTVAAGSAAARPASARAPRGRKNTRGGGGEA